MKKVSIVLPTYNGSEFLRQSVDSVLNQTYTGLQLIIVDDCSTDDTSTIADAYAKQDPRVLVIHNPTNQKLPRSLNIGFDAADGDYFSWTSDDNWYELEAIEKMVRCLDDRPDVGLVAADFRKYNAGEISVVHIDASPAHLLQDTIGACFLYRSSMAREVGGYNVNCFLAEDYEYWLRMGLKAKFATIGEVLYNYRVHPKSLTGSREREIANVSRRVKASMLEQYKAKFPDCDFSKAEKDLLLGRLLADKDESVLDALESVMARGEIANYLKLEYKHSNDLFYLDMMAKLGPCCRLRAKWVAFRHGRRNAGEPVGLLLLKCLVSRRARSRFHDLRDQWRAGAGKFIMTLVVKNEAEIIERNIRFHCAMGCDGFIVSAHNCTDGTNEILERLKKEGLVLEILYRTSEQHMLNVWVAEMIRIARKKYGAKWMINADADEFYYSKCHDLKKSIVDSAKTGANVLWVDSTFLCPDDRDDYWNCPYFVTHPLSKWKANRLGVLESHAYDNFIGTGKCTKVIHRTSGWPRPQKGNHDIDIWRKRAIQCPDIVLYHYHAQNYKNYVAKAMRWRDAAKLKPAGEGEHLKDIIRLLEDGRLRELYDSYYGADKREFLLKHGVVTVDTSVRDFLEEKGIA